MAAVWSDDDARLMRELVASGAVPALSRLTGDGGVRERAPQRGVGARGVRLHREPMWTTSIRSFLIALIVPRVDRTYDAVFDLTPAQFDTAFRQYAEHQFKPPAH